MQTWRPHVCCHNALRNITAELLSGICHDVSTEPPLQPLTGEFLEPKTANHQDEARADIHVRGFWGQLQSAKWSRQRSWAGILFSLVFSTTGGMGKEAIVFYHQLADHLSHRSSTSYSRLWLLFGALCLFLYYGWLQCASMEVGSFCIAPQMPLLRWAACIGTTRFWGSPRCLGPSSELFSVAGVIQLSSTYQLVLGVVGKGSPSSPEKKLDYAPKRAAKYSTRKKAILKHKLDAFSHLLLFTIPNRMHHLVVDTLQFVSMDEPMFIVVFSIIHGATSIIIVQVFFPIFFFVV